ncbi:glycosyl transferase family 2 [Flavobacterium branchiophilum NBRC 15030 = ATCC 35035]|uniref:Glycosyl transferase family 2 n=1 Tax=Flavobacterium branchiophilum TaxID=55197 RepID=A0A543G4X1_9FLAO|nr:glycosyltransferase family A protein [Flavobacterium branchiophilum]OXA69336.1 glycosyl transferase family 2 [Flavobacterium branchiophilum NBRC 15030 = ATCC 35035]TQM41107.1 glycosyl transferase family 2 [Flavobacterium branchiophilum]GEM55583.1 glycosyl transferase family 2 [Flavobacterium branchiophilum NBRC 15030 = ATCC 35035]
MKYYIVIPAHNEARFIGQTLESIVQQTILPTKVVVVNDHSTDQTANIVLEYAKKHPFISLTTTQSQAIHLPGSKVIRAFEKGLATLDNVYDFIVKLDADLILPPHYFESLIAHFQQDKFVGMVGGFAYIEKNNQWILENLTDKDHIRGAFKAYRKACFEAIGGLKPAMGWDTVDELLAKYNNWKVVTDAHLKVKHLKPTGANYNQTARFKQGEAFYTLGYGFWITAIASAKLAFMKQKPFLFLDYMRGFWKAKWAHIPLLVTPEQAQFIRNYRWKKIKAKLF